VGEEVRYEHKYRGFNYRMDGVQGAVLGVKLRYLDQWTEARRQRAGWYARELGGLEGLGLTRPDERGQCRHVYHLYVVRTPHRDDVRRHLSEAGLRAAIRTTIGAAIRTTPPASPRAER
jgi:dTDP-4-amino-4,6-dideoxygalactose transaminase